MRKTRKKIKNPDLRFASSESFGLFMEGLRALREYSKEAQKDLPDRDTLHRQLDDAIECLEKCEARDPENAPALYSLGLALTMRNQLHYAKMLLDRGKLAESLAKATPALAEPGELYDKAGGDQLLLSSIRLLLTPQGNLERDSQARSDTLALLSRPPGPREWPLLGRAGELFQFVQQKGQDDELKTAAMFNLAHVYAKHDEVPDLKKDEVPDLKKTEAKKTGGLTKAKDLLEKLIGKIDSMNEHVVTPYPHPLKFVARLLARRASFWIARTLERIGWTRSDSKPRQKFDETTTIRLQTRALLEWVSLRIDLANVSIASIEERTNSFGKKIGEEKTVPSGVKNDLIADVRTKMGFLLYERAFAVPADREPALKKAEGYLRDALVLKKNWDPAQIYLAQVLQAQARFDEADRYLEAVLGAETAEPQKESAKGDSTSKTDS
jgi:tetratricopeptide (TPR) repeat protein